MANPLSDDDSQVTESGSPVKKLVRVTLNEDRSAGDFLLTFEDGSQLPASASSPYLDGLKQLPYDPKLSRLGPPVPVRSGDETLFAVTMHDGSLRIVSIDSPYLLEFIGHSMGPNSKLEANRLFVRKSLNTEKDNETEAVFSVSPVVSASSDEAPNRNIKVTIPKLDIDGAPNPKYEAIVRIMKEQECDFVRLHLYRNVVTDPPNSYRIMGMPESPQANFRADDPKRYDPKAWYSRAVTYGELRRVCPELSEAVKGKEPDATVVTHEGGPLWVFNVDLKDAVDRYGQYRVYQESTAQLDLLRRPEQFSDFIGKDFQKTLAINSSKIGVSPEEVMEQAYRMGMKTDMSLDDMLQGREVVHTVMPDGSIKLMERKRTYSLGLTIKEQMDKPDPRLSPQQQKENAMVQVANFSAQKALQKHLVHIAKEANIVLKGNYELMEANVLPIPDPYRRAEDMKVLSAEYAEMIGENLLNGIMLQNGAAQPPHIILEGFRDEHSKGAKIMRGILEEAKAMGISNPNVAQMLSAGNTVAVRTLRKDRVQEIVEAVKKGFAEGYLPEQIRHRKFMERSEREKMWATSASFMTYAVSEHLSQSETINIF